METNKPEDYSFLFKPVIFIVSLLTGIYFIIWLENLKPSDLGTFGGKFIRNTKIEKSGFYPLRELDATLTAEEMNAAKTAWKYFQNNYHDSTGLVNSFDKYPFCTIEDIGDYGLALASAYELRLIDSTEFIIKTWKLVSAIENLQLYDGKLPGRKYNTLTGKLVQYPGITSTEGWSALEIGKFFRFVDKINLDYPRFSESLKKAVNKWKMDNMIIAGDLYGWSYNTLKGQYTFEQEGRMYSEEYPSKALSMAGFDVSESIQYNDFIKPVEFGNITLPVDAREYDDRFNHNQVVSDPLIMDGIEFGWDQYSRELAYKLYLIQENSFNQNGIIASTCEIRIPGMEHKIYYSAYNNKKRWECFDETGKVQPYKLITVKNAMGWNALYDDDYAKLLGQTVKNLYDQNRGWYLGQDQNGKINTTISANTNGAVLEILNYKRNGRVISYLN